MYECNTGKGPSVSPAQNTPGISRSLLPRRFSLAHPSQWDSMQVLLCTLLFNSSVFLFVNTRNLLPFANTKVTPDCSLLLLFMKTKVLGVKPMVLCQPYCFASTQKLCLKVICCSPRVL